MGANSSSISEEDINQAVTNITNSVSNSTDVGNKSNMTNINEVIFQNGCNVLIEKNGSQEKFAEMGSIDCGGGELSITLKSQQISNSILQADQKFTSDFSNKLMTEIQNNLLNTLKQKNSGLNIGSLNQSNIKETIKNYTENNVSSIVTNQITNVQTAHANNKNSLNLKNCGIIKADGCNFNSSSSQTIILKNISSAISKGIFTNLVQNKDINTQTNKISQTNLGIFGGLLGLIILCCICFCFYRFYSGASDNAGMPNDVELTNLAKNYKALNVD